MGVPVETGEGRLNVGGVTTVVYAQFTRPADTTAYAANDVVSDSTVVGHPLVFQNCARFQGGTGIIYSGLMFASTDATVNPNFDLVLFDTPSFTMAADNAAGTVTDTEAYNIVAIVTFDGTNAANVSTVGANLVIGATAIGQAFKCGSNSRDLYGMIIDRGGYTPASAEIFRFKLAITQD